MQLEVGNVIAAVWRPGLYYQSETLQALGGSETDVRSTEQALRMLVERLDELLLYVEPSANGLASYSHKTRELLILACTEAENQMKRYLTLANCPREGGLNTRDYVRLAPKLYLSEYVIALKPYQDVESLKPFRGWEAARPTQSLPWYDAYNKTKHDRTSHFSEATLANCLAAVAANVVLFCTRWSPFFLIDGSGPLSSLVNQLFRIELRDPDVTSFYVPKSCCRETPDKISWCSIGAGTLQNGRRCPLRCERLQNIGVWLKTHSPAARSRAGTIRRRAPRSRVNNKSGSRGSRPCWG